MGNSSSVSRRRSSQRSNGGALYGEPVGATAAAAATRDRANYTPAQLQALYLSRGRPDMAFLTNQSTVIPNQVPEMQHTSTVKNHVNLKKSSLKLVSVDGGHLKAADANKFCLEFAYDATKPCRVKIWMVAVESIDKASGCSSFASAHGDQRVLITDLPEGLGQKFCSRDMGEGGVVDFAQFSASELQHETCSRQYPLIISLEVRGNQMSPQSQSTFITFVNNPKTGWEMKVLKQKIQVDGTSYELQEIYGIDGAVAAAPKAASDPTSQTQREEVDVPEGAECIICLSEPRNTTVLPCRHMCLCTECAEALRKTSSTCPICRTPVESLLQIQVEHGPRDYTNAQE